MKKGFVVTCLGCGKKVIIKNKREFSEDEKRTIDVFVTDKCDLKIECQCDTKRGFKNELTL